MLIMVVFTVVFGKLAKLPSEGVPYPILEFSAGTEQTTAVYTMSTEVG